MGCCLFSGASGGCAFPPVYLCIRLAVLLEDQLVPTRQSLLSWYGLASLSSVGLVLVLFVVDVVSAHAVRRVLVVCGRSPMPLLPHSRLKPHSRLRRLCRLCRGGPPCLVLHACSCSCSGICSRRSFRGYCHGGYCRGGSPLRAPVFGCVVWAAHGSLRVCCL